MLFDGEAIVKVMRPHVDEAWKAFEEANDQESLLCLMNTFWFMKETETLLFAQAYVERLETEDVNLSNLEFKPDSSIPRPAVLGVLGAFMYSSLDNFCIAINLLFDYLEKQPGRLPKVLHILTEEFGFKHTSFSNDFLMQRVVVNELRQRIGDNNELFSRLFIALAKMYLRISFETRKLKGNFLNDDSLRASCYS